MRLPALLRPWADWLALFPPENAAPLGELLLRLSPLVGPLRRRAVAVAVEPAGIGDIVRRGHYERLLIGEWALLDAAPDEFVRRAGSGELLFTGPEPADSEHSLRSVALFDAGPAQLGAPRLAHIALFILLARRAELAGATFEWGVLQEPGRLYAADGGDALRRLLGARTLSVLDQDGMAQWDEMLGAPIDDGWLVGDAGALRPAALRSAALVRCGWLGDELEVTLTGQGQSRTVALPLPAPDDGVRLLRKPFEAPAKPLGMHVPAGVHSLKRAPMFGNQRGWVGVPMVDGSVTLYHVPDSLQAKPGRPRNGGKPMYAEAIIAAGVFQRAFGAVALHDGALRFFGFPGPFFNKHNDPPLPLPEPELFQATPGALRWARAFHLTHRIGKDFTERVLILDKHGRLVCWTRRAGAGERVPERTEFKLVAEHVIGAIQHENRLLFAVGLPHRTDAYALSSTENVPAHLFPLMHTGRRFLFGDPARWHGSRGMYALQLEGDDWLVGESASASRIKLRDGQVVLGVARRTGQEGPGLVVLEPGGQRIALYQANTNVTLVEATEAIARASFDPSEDRLAWLGRKNGTLTVRGIALDRPFLQTVPKHGNDSGGHDGEH